MDIFDDELMRKAVLDAAAQVDEARECLLPPETSASS